MGCLADFLGYNAIGWDLTGGVGPFSLGLSGTWGKGATGAEGGIGIGFPDLKAGLSWGFADAAGAIPGLPCVTNRKCPCRSSAICKYELESTDPYLSGYTPGPNYYPYPF